MNFQVEQYGESTLGSEELQRAIDLAWEAVKADGDADSIFQEIGIEPAEARTATIAIKQDAGIAPLLIAIVVAIGVEVSKDSAIALWKLVERQLKKSTSGDVLKRPKGGIQGPEDAAD